MRIVIAVLVVAMSVCVAVPIGAQPVIPEHADEGDFFDSAAAAVIPSGDRLLVAPWRGRALGGKEVFVYRRQGVDWVREAAFETGWNGVPSQMPGMSGGRVNASTITLADPWIFLGQPQETVSGLANSGRVLVYKRTGEAWGLHSTLQPPVAVASGGFGISNSINGEWAAIGQYGQNTVHVYRLVGDNWTPEQIVAPAGQTSFGSELAFSGNQLIVRARADLHVYTLSAGTWIFSQLMGSTLANVTNGHWALDGDLIATRGAGNIAMFRRTAGVWSSAGNGPVASIVFGMGIQDGPIERLVAYGSGVTIWSRPSGGSWSAGQTISVPFPGPPFSSSFGQYSFAFSGNSLFIGARRGTLNRSLGQGLAFEYDSLGSSLRRTFAHGNGFLGSEFGRTIALMNGRAYISARGQDLAGERDVGAIHIADVTVDGWRLTASRHGPGGGAFDVFGETLGGGGGLLVVGSLEDYGGINDHGRMRVLSADGTLVCELTPPITPRGTAYGWGDGVNSGYPLDFEPILSPSTDGVNVVAIYENRLFAWRVNGGNCGLVGEISIPGRGAVPGAPGTEVESQIRIQSSSTDRFLLTECCGAANGAATDAKAYIFDYSGNAWSASYTYNVTQGGNCPGFGGRFVARDRLRNACRLPSSAWVVVENVEVGGIWTSTQVPIPAMEASEFPWGFAGETLITGVFPTVANARTLIVRGAPDYAIDQTLGPTQSCVVLGSSALVYLGENEIFVPCHTSDTAGDRRSGSVQIFTRSSRGGGFSQVPQNLPGPLGQQIFQFGMEDVR